MFNEWLKERRKKKEEENKRRREQYIKNFDTRFEKIMKQQYFQIIDIELLLGVDYNSAKIISNEMCKKGFVVLTNNVYFIAFGGDVKDYLMSQRNLVMSMYM